MVTIVELDTYGNYRDKTSHNKKNILYLVYWYPNEEFAKFENELIENRKSWI